MLKNYRCGALVLLMALLMWAVFPAYAESDPSSLDKLEKYMLENFSIVSYGEFLDACEEQKGEDFAREKAKFYYNQYPDYIETAVCVLYYCNPFSEPELVIEAATKILWDHDLPSYSEDMSKVPHEDDVGYCAEAYMAQVYAYYQLGHQEQLVKAADWVISYAGYNERQFLSALSAADYVTLHFVHSGNSEKALYYAKQVESLLEKYAGLYPESMDKFIEEYETTFIPILEKYPQDQEQQGE